MQTPIHLTRLQTRSCRMLPPALVAAVDGNFAADGAWRGLKRHRAGGGCSGSAPRPLESADDGFGWRRGLGAFTGLEFGPIRRRGPRLKSFDRGLLYHHVDQALDLGQLIA